ERPLDGPDTAFRGGDGRVDDAVLVTVQMLAVFVPVLVMIVRRRLSVRMLHGHLSGIVADKARAVRSTACATARPIEYCPTVALTRSTARRRHYCGLLLRGRCVRNRDRRSMETGRRYSRLAPLVFSAVLAPSCVAQPLPLEQIKLPPGFQISVFADNVPN